MILGWFPFGVVVHSNLGSALSNSIQMTRVTWGLGSFKLHRRSIRRCWAVHRCPGAFEGPIFPCPLGPGVPKITPFVPRNLRFSPCFRRWTHRPVEAFPPFLARRSCSTCPCPWSLSRWTRPESRKPLLRGLARPSLKFSS